MLTVFSDKLKFMNELKDDREAFTANLEKYAEEAQRFTTYCNIDAAEDYKEMVKALQNTLTEAQA